MLDYEINFNNRTEIIQHTFSNYSEMILEIEQ